jgi:hypothetical protein
LNSNSRRYTPALDTDSAADNKLQKAGPSISGTFDLELLVNITFPFHSRHQSHQGGWFILPGAASVERLVINGGKSSLTKIYRSQGTHTVSINQLLAPFESAKL